MVDGFFFWTLTRVSCVDLHILPCIPVDWERRNIKDFVKLCIISFMSDMQFEIYSIFHERMSWTHGFCKPLLCGCTYCYFVYWNKERSIYKIIKWSSPSSLHWKPFFIYMNCTFNEIPCGSFCRTFGKYKSITSTDNYFLNVWATFTVIHCNPSVIKQPFTATYSTLWL